MKAVDSKSEEQKAEARKKWGQTPAYKEYETKTKGYSQSKWDMLAAGMEQIMAEFAVCMKKGEASDCLQAQALVKALQTHITENYYPCTNEILLSLGQMYVTDERFKKNIDKHAGGTAVFICEAIKVYCSTACN